MANYPLGTYIQFEHKLGLWQQSQLPTNVRLDNEKRLPTTSNSIQGSSLNTQISNNYNPTQACQTSVQIESILTNSPDGLLILKYFKCHEEFNDNIRVKLVDLIIHYIISNEISMSLTLADNIADQIVFMFPSEIKVSFKCKRK